MFQEIKMFTKHVLRIGALSFELCRRTEKLTIAIQESWAKDGSKTMNGLEQLKCQEREIIKCATRLLQCIDDNEPIKEPESNSNGQESVKISALGTTCDSGIDVTEEEKEDSVFRGQDMMNGVTVRTGGGDPLETVQALRETLRSLKRTTDKAVVEFLIRSRDVLQQEMKNQSDMDRDHKLLDLISDVLKHKQEADKQMKEIESTYDEENPVSVLEKSLCYVLVDKALLNCLLLLDKAHMEGKLKDCELELQYRKAGHKVLYEFSQSANEKTQFNEIREELRKKDEVIEKMRIQIRDLSNDRVRLENENKSLQEKSRCWMLKSKELEMQNSAIDEERQLLKEKVYFLDESMAALESCTKNLRQQIRQRNEEKLAQEQEQQMEYPGLDNKETVKYTKGMPEVTSECRADSEISLREEASKVCSINCQAGKDGKLDRMGNLNIVNSVEVSKIQYTTIEKDSQNLSSGKDLKGTIAALTSENEQLRAKVQSLQIADKELRIKMTTLMNGHDDILEKKNEELRLANDRSKAFEEDLNEKFTEIVLLKAQVLELEKRSANAQETIKKLRNELCLMKEGKDKTEVSNTTLLRKKECLQEEVSALLGQLKTYMNKDVDQSDNIGELSTNVSSLREEILCLNRSLQGKEETIKTLNESLRASKNREHEMAALLEDLVQRIQLLASKLEMIGAVTVVRNDFDVPDGYQEAVDGILRSQTSMVEKGVLAMMEAAEENDHERKQLEREQRRLKDNIETLETENVLLKVQVGDLSQSVEELEDEIIYMKHGVRSDSRQGRHPGTPKSSGSGGHRVTFGGEVGMEKRESERLQSLIQNAKGRCVNLERQIRSNTSLLKVSQDRKEALEKDCAELRRRNSYLRSYLADFQQMNKELETKVFELEDRLKAVGEGKSFDEMEKQSLEDRLKIMEGQTKYLKEERQNLKNRVQALQRELKTSDETQLTANRQSEGLETTFSVVKKGMDDVFSRKTNLEYEKECLKNKAKQQSARSRILKSEIFEFLDDVRCLESELSCAVANVRSSDSDKEILQVDSAGDTRIVSTWRDEASLCQEEGMAPIMAEILDIIKSVVQRLQNLSRTGDMLVSPVDGNSVELFRDKLMDEIVKLRIEKRQIQREVFAVKAVCEHLWDQTDSHDGASRATERKRSLALRKQVLSFIEKNSRMEGEILDHLQHQSMLEDELMNLKNNILNFEVEKEVLSYLSDSGSSRGASYGSHKPYDPVARNFCFVKREGSRFESQEIPRGVASEHDNEDVLSYPSDEGVCHSPDQVSSCDSGYLSGRFEEGHSPVLSNKVDPGQHHRHLLAGQPERQSFDSFYDNITREELRSDTVSISITPRKPKGILKKSPGKQTKESSPSDTEVAEDTNEIDMPGCKVCSFADLFKPFKRANQELEDHHEHPSV